MPSPSTTAPGTPSRARVGPAAVLRVGALAAGCALVANLLALLVGRLAGADMVVGRPGSAGQEVGPAPVVVATLVGLAAGTVLLLVLRARGARAWTAVAVAGLVAGVVTTAAPLSMDAGTTTRVTLAAMHVLTGLAWFVVVRRAARTRSS
ncbi:hypothetical protein GTQ99_12975 [Kineococcus sp. T13]|uniref:DUF6069 family protein n=1 Tax=Kineococcus vitellinus TaxID=2696565 RepID=UPI0014123D0A|nr:DUF6069 family protein [Kineococcus vitellinus]NAZ76318.1 hypothetical protein [Kineococcus vitellinus]